MIIEKKGIEIRNIWIRCLFVRFKLNVVYLCFFVLMKVEFDVRVWEEILGNKIKCEVKVRK